MINSFNILKSNITGFADMWSSLLRSFHGIAPMLNNSVYRAKYRAGSLQQTLAG